jgi:hypothetical protein
MLQSLVLSAQRSKVSEREREFVDEKSRSGRETADVWQTLAMTP